MERKLDWLDVLRFLSGLAVVLFHYLANHPRRAGLPSNAIAEYGYLGVEVFFLISGFVILISAVGRRPDEFAVARAARLWPTFALCATITACVLVARGQPVGLTQFLANLTMIPWYLGQPSLDGVYWTLAFEIAFYGAIFLVIMFGQIKRIREIVLSWVALLLIWRIFHLPSFPPFGNYFELFAGGCVLALLRRKPDLLLWLAMAVCVVIIAYGVWTRASYRPVEPWIAALVIVSVIPLFFISMPKIPFAGQLGRITYPMYLLHNQVGFTLIALGFHWAVTATAMIVLAWLVFRFVEEPTEHGRRAMFDFLAGRPIRWVTRRLQPK